MTKPIKYISISILVLIILLGFASYAFYNYYLPKAIAKSISSEEPQQLTFLPKKMQTQIVEAKKSINSKLDDMPEALKELDLTFDDIIYMVDHTDAKEVLNAIDELNNTNLQNIDQVFDIGLRNIKIEGYDLEMFRPTFHEKVRLNRVKRVLEKINENNLTTSVSIPVARETVKQILLEKKEKIDAALNQVNGN